MYTQQKSTIQKILDENSQLVLLIVDLQSKGKQNECFEHQRTLHRNLTYLIQFDSSTSHHQNNLPPPDAFIQTQSTMINGQSDQIYRTQTNSPASSSNILNQTSQNTNLYPSTNAVNKPPIPQQRSSYPQQTYSIQQNGYGQYPMHHQQQNPSSNSNSSTNTQNLVSNQQNMYNNYNEQQMYHPQQNYLVQQQWQNQPRMPIQQQQQYTSYQQQLPPQT